MKAFKKFLMWSAIIQSAFFFWVWYNIMVGNAVNTPTGDAIREFSKGFFYGLIH